MAHTVIDRGATPPVVDFATRTVATDSGEIDRMNLWRRLWAS